MRPQAARKQLMGGGGQPREGRVRVSDCVGVRRAGAQLPAAVSGRQRSSNRNGGHAAGMQPVLDPA